MPEPLRVLHFVNNLDVGGISTWLLALIPRLSLLGIESHVATTGPKGGPLDAQFSKVCRQVYYLPAGTRLLSFRQGVKNMLRRYGPFHVVHSHYVPSALPLLWARSVPVRIAHSHTVTSDLVGKPFLMKKALEPLARLLGLCSSTHAIACSQAAIYPKAGKFIWRKKHWQVQYCGFDVDSYRPLPNPINMRKELGIKESTIVIGHVGRIATSPDKNHPFLLQVFQKFHLLRPDSLLMLVGDGPARSALEELAIQLQIRDSVIFLGSRDDVNHLLSGAVNLFAFPSRYEGLGLAVVEAQAAGLPCLVSDSIPQEATVVPELVNRMSIHLPPEDWAERMAAIFDSPHSISRMDAWSAVAESRFNIDVSARSIREIYAQ